jgi:hypothetical protein
MKRSVGDDNALQFLFRMSRKDFTPADVAHYFWQGTVRLRWFGKVPERANGWGKRLRRLETQGLLKRWLVGAALYEWTTEGLLAVNLLTKEADANA